MRYPTDCSRLLGIIFFCRKSMVAKKDSVRRITGYSRLSAGLLISINKKTGRLLSRFSLPAEVASRAGRDFLLIFLYVVPYSSRTIGILPERPQPGSSQQPACSRLARVQRMSGASLHPHARVESSTSLAQVSGTSQQSPGRCASRHKSPAQVNSHPAGARVGSSLRPESRTLYTLPQSAIFTALRNIRPRVYRVAAEADLEVQVVAGAAAGAAHQTDQLALSHLVPH